MSFTSVRPYFRTRMNSLGHKEWTDGFNFENIPESIQNRTYHIDANSSSGNSQNQTVLDASMNVTIRLYILGYRDPADGIDQAMSFAQAAICDIVNPTNANGTDIKDVQYSSKTIRPRSEDNDNTIVVEMNFAVRIFLETV